MSRLANSSQPSLFVIGLGVSIPDHTTFEAYRAMGLCKRIYSIVQERPSIWLPPDVSGALPVVNLMKTYNEGVLRAENYERAAATIVNAVAETSPIGYVTYGNPLAYDSVAQNLVRTAAESNIRYRVIPGISSIDTLLCDLGVDMAPGIQIYEASWLVAAQVSLQPETAIIILQLGAFGSFRTHYQTRPLPAALDGLVEYLIRTHPPEHQVFVVRSSGQTDGGTNVRAVQIKDLCGIAAEDILNASMYVPAAGNPVWDRSAIASMVQS